MHSSYGWKKNPWQVRFLCRRYWILSNLLSLKISIKFHNSNSISWVPTPKFTLGPKAHTCHSINFQNKSCIGFQISSPHKQIILKNIYNNYYFIYLLLRDWGDGYYIDTMEEIIIILIMFNKGKNKVNFLRGEEKVVAMSVLHSCLVPFIQARRKRTVFSSSRAGYYRPRAS